MSDLLLRPMEDAEVVAVVDVLMDAREDASARGTMPPLVHPRSGAETWFRERVLGRREIWVAAREGAVVGVLVLDEAFVDHLYVAPAHQRRGIGRALLELAKSRRPGGFGLWVFDCNTPAIELYERDGLVLAERGDGAGNEERAPDRRYVWAGPSRH